MSNNERKSGNSSFSENKSNISGSVNKLADYVSTIKAENEDLKAEKQRLISSFEKEIQSIKSTYINEMDSLRKTLDDVTSSKIRLTFDNKNMQEELEILDNKLTNETNQLDIVKSTIIELKEEINNFERKLEGYEALQQAYIDLSNENNKNKTAMKNDRIKCIELENRIVKLSEEAGFYKRLDANSKCTIESNLRENAIKVETKVNEQVETIKMQLNADFQHCKLEIERFYIAKCNDIEKLNENLVIENNKLKREIEDIRIGNLSEKRDRQIENRLKEILNENESLKKDLKLKLHELSVLETEKNAVESELLEFRSLLNNCESSVGPSSPKRKRIVKEHASNESKFDITACCKDKVKIYCDDQCDGNCIKLQNVTDKPINLNEWKIEFLSDDFKDVYCFPDRIIRGNQALTVWKKDAPVADDGDNIRMNVGLPDFSKSFSCELTNDMYEFEASFQLKRNNQRKFIKANLRGV